MFEDFRIKGIFKTNKEQVSLENPCYVKERNQGSMTGLVSCKLCKKFVKQKSMTKHSTTCKGNTGNFNRAHFEKIHFLNDFPIETTDIFKKYVLESLREDSIGTICRSDEGILTFGFESFLAKADNKEKLPDACKKVRADMRQLANLYTTFITRNPPELRYNHSVDMLHPNNFNTLKEAINKNCTNSSEMKPGLKLSFYYLLLSWGRQFEGIMIEKQLDQEAESLRKFLVLIQRSEKTFFRGARSKLLVNKQRTLRKPEELPLESDLLQIRQFVVNTINEISSPLNFVDFEKYVTLRNAVCCRLTLFNARRGGEPARLLLNEWDEGLKDAWIDKQFLKSLDEVEKKLVDNITICYQTGKGGKTLVPVLIPKDTIQTINIVCNKQIRKAVGISNSNPYVFAPTKSLTKVDNHVSGWHVVKDVCKNVPLQKEHLITATKNRHFVSTLYSSFELPLRERQLFFDHMGHSEATNIENYQCPPALQEITRVGKHLLNIETG